MKSEQNDEIISLYLIKTFSGHSSGMGEGATFLTHRKGTKVCLRFLGCDVMDAVATIFDGAADLRSWQLMIGTLVPFMTCKSSF